MTKDPINAGSYTLGLLVSNNQNMANTQTQNQALLSKNLNDAYEKLQGANILNLRQTQLDKENAFKQESLNLQKEQMSNQVKQWYDYKKQWEQQNKLERDKIQEGVRQNKLNLDFLKEQFAYQKLREEPSLEIQRRQAESTRGEDDSLLTLPLREGFGVAGESRESEGNTQKPMPVIDVGDWMKVGNGNENKGSVGGIINANGLNSNIGTAGNIRVRESVEKLQEQYRQANTTKAGINGGLQGEELTKDYLRIREKSNNATQEGNVSGYKQYSQIQNPQEDSTNGINAGVNKANGSNEVDMMQYFTKTPPPKKEPKKIKVWEAIQRNLELGRELTPKQKMAAKVLGIPIPDDKDIRVRKSSINNDLQEMKNISDGMRSAGIVLSRLNSESGFWNDVGRTIHRWSWGFSRNLDDKEREFINEANKFRLVINGIQYGNQQSQYKDEKSIQDYGIGQRWTSLAEAVGIMKQGLGIMINRMEAILSTTNIKGMDLSQKDLGIIQKNYENAKKNLEYLNSLKDAENFNEKKIVSDINKRDNLREQIGLIE